MTRLVVPGALRADAGGRGAVEISGATVREALDRLAADLPRLERRLRDERGTLREHVLLFVDAVDIRDQAGQDTALRGESEVYVVAAMSGG
ncbi:MAG: MoaD/ThiS family protein [Chloroflexi bacterium]|jgi:sulfur-carrier protein|nr:MAG: MoaD/ThiS family protein [Chloroflexota bacterium]